MSGSSGMWCPDMTMPRERPVVHIGDTTIGTDHPPVFLAEIGTYFNQDITLADRMIRNITEAAQQVPEVPVLLKGEILHTADICLDDDTIEVYTSKSGHIAQERYRSLIERKVVSLDDYRRLLTLSALPVVTSVYDLAGVDFAVEIGVAALKIASANITHVPLIRHAAGKGLPIIIDTGRASLEEVAGAVAVARKAGCPGIIVEHSPDGHPAMPEAHNLRLLQTYASALEVPVGLSDHHVGDEMLYVAVALGASIIEKGVCHDSTLLEQDAAHAMDLRDLPSVLRRVHNAWAALGRTRRDPTAPICGVIATTQRQGLIAKRDLVPGDRVSLDTIAFAWPAKGIPVHHWDTVAGWEVVAPVGKGKVIDWPHLRPRQGE